MKIHAIQTGEVQIKTRHVEARRERRSARVPGIVDGVAQDEKLHRGSTRRLRELCARRPVVVVPTHDPHGAQRLAAAQTTTV